MVMKQFTAVALAASLSLLPAERAAADTKDLIVGAIIGGIIGSEIQKNQQRKQRATVQRQNTVTTVPSGTAYTSYSTRNAPRGSYNTRSYAPSIPATTEGREIQSALNYFGFEAGTVDGRVGRNTRAAIADYQDYMGYPETGKLTSFEQHVLTRSYLRAEAGGANTWQEIARHPDGTRGLLKIYRAELAGNDTTLAPTNIAAPVVTSTDI